jgi:dGTPase
MLQKYMEWQKLLSEVRTRDKYPQSGRRPPWQVDFDRITFSSAFRRLQGKTQVFSLSSSDYVRTRLTHSMETAVVARSLGTAVGYALKEELPKDIHPLEVGMIVSAAALAHDIGNPPFGHSGEDAIREWFAGSNTAREFREEVSPSEAADFMSFEGNAQGFRVLTRLQMYREDGGMRLTAATLGAAVKYPARSMSPDGRKYYGASTKKFGFFQADKAQFEEVAAETGLIRRSEETDCWSRHPLAFLVEAADDICYRIVDLEDACRQGLLAHEETKELLQGLATESQIQRVEKQDTKREKINMLRAFSIGNVIVATGEVFAANRKAILEGDFDQDLISKTQYADLFETIGDVQKTKVYKTDRVLRIEAAGFRVIGGLLDAFAGAINDVARINSRKAGPSCESEKLVQLLPDEFIGPKREPANSAYERLLRITDYVCGMTDSYALQLFRNLSGISLP